MEGQEQSSEGPLHHHNGQCMMEVVKDSVWLGGWVEAAMMSEGAPRLR